MFYYLRVKNKLLVKGVKHTLGSLYDQFTTTRVLARIASFQQLFVVTKSRFVHIWGVFTHYFLEEEKKRFAVMVWLSCKDVFDAVWITGMSASTWTLSCAKDHHAVLIKQINGKQDKTRF